jgi:hypothetical protein
MMPSIIIHVLAGTVVLSSLIFIGARDTILVVARFMLSVLVCRAILMYEVAGIRDRYKSNCGGLVPLELLPFSQADYLITKVEGPPRYYVSHTNSV